MSESMVDKVAKRLNPRAFEIFEANPIGSLERGLAITQMSAARIDARTAIAAMREPTEDMLIAGSKIDTETLEWDTWQAMIDAALKEDAKV